MKYKFSIWYKPNKSNMQFLEDVVIEAESYKEALDSVAQLATDRTEIEDIKDPVKVSQVQERLL